MCKNELFSLVQAWLFVEFCLSEIKEVNSLEEEQLSAESVVLAPHLKD